MLALVLLGSAGGASWFFYFKPKGEKVQPEPEPKPAGPIVYLPLDPVVVNLADEGGGRFAQVGITFQIRDAKLVEDVKKALPSIRNRILISLSERKAQDLLSKEGKERLAADILVETGRVFGIEPAQLGGPATAASSPEKAAAPASAPETAAAPASAPEKAAAPASAPEKAAAPASAPEKAAAPASAPEKAAAPASAPALNPVVKVLFSSLIIQ